jgi:ring-1,2-phenylacetyl-CoA epoxidase subunit PaaE
MATTAVAAAEPADRITTIPDPKEPIPRVAWPTVGVFVGSLAVFGGATALAVGDVWPWPVSTVLNAVAIFAIFTVTHDASHRTISTSPAINDWLGRISTFLFAPHASYPIFRFIHMQHHRFTNDHEGRDPDHYSSMSKGGIQGVLRWLTLDLHYLAWVAPKLGSRPRRDKVELALTWLLLIAVNVGLIAAGYGFELLVLFWVPQRIALFALAWAFDWLPHHGLEGKQPETRFQATYNRVGAERVMNVLLLYQNYHLVHHLHPLIPFYRYITVWRRGEEDYLQNDPALCTVRGRRLTVDEYRALRDLQNH